MKIMMVHNTYREKGGEEIVFDNERSLLERKGHTVIPYVRSNSELRDGNIVHRISMISRMVWSSKSHKEVAALLDAESPDLVHIHNTFLAISPSIYSACSELAIPVVQTLHNFRLLCPAGSFYRDGKICEECVDQTLLQSIRHGCYRNSRMASTGVALMLSVHRFMDTWLTSVKRFIALTHFAKGKFVSAGFPADRIVVKPNFLGTDPGERKSGGEYGAFIGRLDPKKGLSTLLDAWGKLCSAVPLQIVGDGPDRPEFEVQAERLRLSDVKFRGRLSRAETMEVIKGARFLIVPSPLFEGFPMAIVEAFASGTPVLCSRLGGLPEIVEENKTGLHFHPGDAQDLARKVDWAWSHPMELAEMGRTARRKYEKYYTAERNYALLMEIYEQARGIDSGAESPPELNAPEIPSRIESDHSVSIG